MEIMPIFSTDYFCNSYFIFNKLHKDLVIIDPIDFTEEMLLRIENRGLNVKAIILTSSYQTYIKGINKLLKIYNPDIYTMDPKKFDFKSKKLVDHMEIEISDLVFQVRFINHNKIDSAIFICKNCIFTGESFFAGKLGKILLPASENILEKNFTSLFDIKEFYILYPKYGPLSILKNEVEHEID